MSAEELDLLFWNLLPAVILGAAYAIWKFWTHHQEKAAARLALKEKRKKNAQTPKKPNPRHGRN